MSSLLWAHSCSTFYMCNITILINKGVRKKNACSTYVNGMCIMLMILHLTSMYARVHDVHVHACVHQVHIGEVKLRTYRRRIALCRARPTGTSWPVARCCCLSTATHVACCGRCWGSSSWRTCACMSVSVNVRVSARGL